MVDICISEAISVSNCNNICVIKEENGCVCCYKLKQELEVTLQEFSLAEKKIQLLQEGSFQFSLFNSIKSITSPRDLLDIELVIVQYIQIRMHKDSIHKVTI